MLALSNSEVNRLDLIIRNHMKVLFHVNRLADEGKMPSRRAVYRFFRDAGEAGVDTCLLALADLRATFENDLKQDFWLSALEVSSFFLDNWFNQPAVSVKPPALLDGDELMEELHLSPGRMVGELLEAIREAQAGGEVDGRPQAISYARQWLAQHPQAGEK
jgi:hypothetical protein